ncbi:NUDIX hydrolase [Pseudomarimonas arenosa]|uniref:NUDIX domain-containing protein n=1 Tax=Pseudomarimonas arenosa TaxID=2774145 RepID=A0AAW3ZJ33_9GAMM|nr:NUDIX domain-containing protein [Pseudomarimonas arenosa]MBD8525234.1 NUDIX domain-containing protein [Pseudomarimonas arenosa]
MNKPPADAIAIVLLREGRILLVQRSQSVPRPGFWSVPTGKLERGESQPAAVQREAEEELGLSVRPIAQVWQCLTDDGRYRLHWWLAEAKAAAANLCPAPEEVADWRWIRPFEFEHLSPRFEQHRAFFKERLPSLLSVAPPLADESD